MLVRVLLISRAKSAFLSHYRVGSFYQGAAARLIVCDAKVEFSVNTDMGLLNSAFFGGRWW